MHTIILGIHIFAMVASIGLMIGAIGLGLGGKKLAALVATAGEVLTVAGGVSGALLLLGAPLSIECAMLTAYLASMTALYVFGFGMGNADEARFIRSSNI